SGNKAKKIGWRASLMGTRLEACRAGKSRTRGTTGVVRACATRTGREVAACTAIRRRHRPGTRSADAVVRARACATGSARGRGPAFGRRRERATREEFAPSPPMATRLALGAAAPLRHTLPILRWSGKEVQPPSSPARSRLQAPIPCHALTRGATARNRTNAAPGAPCATALRGAASTSSHVEADHQRVVRGGRAGGTEAAGQEHARARGRPERGDHVVVDRRAGDETERVRQRID